MGILLSIPIGITYNLLVGKLSEILTKNDIMRDKIQKNLIIQIISGVVALILAFFVFGRNKLENNIVKYGLLIGGCILLFYSFVGNWNIIEDRTKLFTFAGIFIFLILYSYRSIGSSLSKSLSKNKTTEHSQNNNRVSTTEIIYDD